MKAIFVTATDTGAGKTVASLCLGLLLKQQGLDVGVYKPIQCGGDDAMFLKDHLGISDKLKDINPYFAKESLSPHIAFARQKTRINIQKIKDCLDDLIARHDFIIVEGAGGLMVPIFKNYTMIDLVKELGLGVVVVSRLCLGTINHTLLTLSQAREQGLRVKGLIFNQTEKKYGIVEKTNPEIIQAMGKVPVLGVIPYLYSFDQEKVITKISNKIMLRPLLDLQKDKYNLTLKRNDKDHVWHPFTQMKDWLKEDPLIIEQAKGCHLKDIDGKTYLDGVSSLWVNIHGHRHPEIDRALRCQINQVSHSTLLGLSNVPSVKLAKALTDIAPKGLKKVFYSDSGSTAVEVALKIAYQYWQNIGKLEKRKIVHFSNAYHGDTLGSVSVGGIKLFHEVYRDLIFKTIAWSTPCPDGFQNKKKFSKEFDVSMDKLDRFFNKCSNQIAALIVEPIVQGAAGMIVWPQGILKRLEIACKKNDILLIADEVATGFGRTGEMFACDQEGVSPDILCLAKGLTGGYLPLAATLATEEIYNGFLFDYKDQKTFFHGHTYTGNPLACAAALANLNIFKKEKTLIRIKPKIKMISDGLKKFWLLPHAGDIRQKGFMVGIELVKDKEKKKLYLWEEKIGIRVCQTARKKGVILRPLGNTIVLMPPLCIKAQEIRQLLDVTYQAIRIVTEKYD